MPSRRAVLGAVGLGLATGASGCLDSLTGGSGAIAGSPDPTLASSIAQPAVRRWGEDPESQRIENVEAWITYCDAAGLRDYRDRIADPYAVWGGNEPVPALGTTAGLQSVDRSITAQYSTRFEDRHILDGETGILTGAVDTAAHRAASDATSPAGTYRGFDLYAREPRERVGESPNGIVTAEATVLTEPDAPRDEVEQDVANGLLRRTIDRSIDEPAPADWVGRTIEGCLPFHYATLTLRHYRNENLTPHVSVRALYVRGERSRVVRARGFPSVEAFEESWDLARAERRLPGFRDAENEERVGGTAGLVSATLPTEDTAVGASG